jgi:hypothetical protein
MPSKRQKGSEWERECCKRLSLWLTNGVRDDLFWRSAMSGGRATIQHRKGIANKTQVGDITAIDPLGEEMLLRHVVVECKFRKNVDMLASFLCKRGSLYGWWHKEVEKAYRVNRDPMVIVLQNRLPALLITTAKAATVLGIVSPVLVLPLWLLNPKVFLLDEVVPRLTHWKDASSSTKGKK